MMKAHSGSKKEDGRKMDSSAENSLLIRSLKDAGCGPQLITKILALREAGNTHDQLRLLTHQRAALLEKMHAAQKKIDCLDYLVFNMKQENITKTGR